jgi:hypothetical protein
MADCSTLVAQLNVDYRIVGGHMVQLLVDHYQVSDVPERETADADLGADWSVVSDPRLLPALLGMGYKQRASNRFTRNLGDDVVATIDVLTKSMEARHAPSRQHGDLFIDEIPGLDLALTQDPMVIALSVGLTTGAHLDLSIRIPGPFPALCLKVLSYKSRLEPKDATDVWRLLAVCHAAGITASDWPKRTTARDTAEALKSFRTPNSSALRAVTNDRSIQTRIRALAQAVGPAPGFINQWAR